jgi:hypothetical protein
VKRSGMRFLPLVALGLCACAQPPVPIAFNGQNKPVILRSTLRASGPRLYSSNYLGLPVGVRAGTEAVVTMYSQQRVDMTLNKIAYQMYPIGVPLSPSPEMFMKKYFVSTPADLGLAKMDPVPRQNIEAGVGAIGMTKEQIYAALGPPNWVDFGQRPEDEATNLSFEQIMERNRWEYRSSDVMFWPLKVAYVFDQNKLVQVIQ